MLKSFKDNIKNSDWMLGAICYALLCIRYLWRGFMYFPQLDDYIQYHNYSAFYGNLRDAVVNLGLLKARPLAGISDVGLWSKFWGNMVIPLLVITLMYVVSGVLLKKVFSKYFSVSKLFLVLYLLMPFGFEGLYWISASSRIVTGLFFASISIWFFQNFLDNKNFMSLVFSALFQLLCFGFYEQSMVFSITIMLLLGIYNIILKNKRGWFSLVTFLNVIAYFGVTRLQKTSILYDSRMKVVLPFINEEFGINFIKSMYQFKKIFVDGFLRILVLGFKNGLNLIIENKGYVILAAVIALAVLTLVFVDNDNREKSKSLIGIVMGLLLFFAPLTPFFIISDSYIPMRNAVTSFAGMALVADIVFTSMFKNKSLRNIICVSMVLVFTICGFAEIESYKVTYDNDSSVAAAFKDVEFKENSAIIGLEEFYGIQNFPYKEHVLSACSSNWALTGMMRCVKNDANVPLIMPISSKTPYMSWSKKSKLLSNFEHIYYYNSGEMIKLSCEKTGDDEYKLYDGTKPFGDMKDVEGQGVFTIYDK